MGGACSAYGGGERLIKGFGWAKLRERDHLGEPGVDGRIKLGWIFSKVECGGMDWIELAQDRNRRRALVTAVMNLRVS